MHTGGVDPEAPVVTGQIPKAQVGLALAGNRHLNVEHHILRLEIKRLPAAAHGEPWGGFAVAEAFFDWAVNGDGLLLADDGNAVCRCCCRLRCNAPEFIIFIDVDQRRGCTDVGALLADHAAEEVISFGRRFRLRRFSRFRWGYRIGRIGHLDDLAAVHTDHIGIRLGNEPHAAELGRAVAPAERADAEREELKLDGCILIAFAVGRRVQKQANPALKAGRKLNLILGGDDALLPRCAVSREIPVLHPFRLRPLAPAVSADMLHAQTGRRFRQLNVEHEILICHVKGRIVRVDLKIRGGFLILVPFLNRAVKNHAVTITDLGDRAANFCGCLRCSSPPIGNCTIRLFLSDLDCRRGVIRILLRERNRDCLHRFGRDRADVRRRNHRCHASHNAKHQ